MIIDSGTRVNNSVYTPDSTARADARPKAEVQQQAPAEPQVNQNAKAQQPQVQTAKASVQNAVQNTAQNAAQIQNQQEQKPIDEKDSKKIKDAVNHANQTMKHAKTKCEFSYHEETKRVSIKVLDADTEEIIREIPPEETLEMLSKMWELAGLLVDEKR